MAILASVALAVVVLVVGYVVWLDLRWNFASDLAREFKSYREAGKVVMTVPLSIRLDGLRDSEFQQLAREAGFTCKRDGLGLTCHRDVQEVVCSESWSFYAAIAPSGDVFAVQTEKRISCL